MGTTAMGRRTPYRNELARRTNAFQSKPFTLCIGRLATIVYPISEEIGEIYDASFCPTRANDHPVSHRGTLLGRKVLSDHGPKNGSSIFRGLFCCLGPIRPLPLGYRTYHH